MIDPATTPKHVGGPDFPEGSTLYSINPETILDTLKKFFWSDYIERYGEASTRGKQYHKCCDVLESICKVRYEVRKAAALAR